MTNVVFDELMKIAGHSPIPEEQVKIVGHDPVLATRFRLGEMAAGIHAACGVAVADLWELRTGRHQQVEVDVRAAAATLRSYMYLRVEGSSVPRPPSITGFYPARDGRWFYLHGNFPGTSARENALAILECDDNIESAAAGVLRWDAQALEDAFADRGCCGAMVRSAEEWALHAQGRVLQTLPVVEVIKIGNSPPEPLPAGDRPLSGIRVLDLTRVLAGPTCARTLAEHGAEALRIGAPHLPSAGMFVMDTGHGKRSAFLDLRRDSDAQKLWTLIGDADVFSQSYRLGALAGRGFSPKALAEARPGIIYVSMNCYGHEGPWPHRRGWEQLAQAVSGIAKEEGEPGNPRLVPAAATDYSTGYMAAFGALVALNRRARQGGSYLVRASLTQSGMLLNRLGRVAEDDATAQDQVLSPDEVSHLTVETDTPFGRMTHLAPVVKLSETPARWTLPTVPLGTHEPAWID